MVVCITYIVCAFSYTRCYTCFHTYKKYLYLLCCQEKEKNNLKKKKKKKKVGNPILIGSSLSAFLIG